MAAIPRPGKTPNGREVRAILKRVIRRVRRNWPRVDIVVRGDSHHARPEAMDWLDDNAIAYAFGLAGNAALKARVAALVEDAAVRRALAGAKLAGGRAKVRRHAAFPYAAQGP